MSTTEHARAKPPLQPSAPVHSNLLQLKCACGGAPGVDGMCGECREKQLQRNAFGEVGLDRVPHGVREALYPPGEPPDLEARAVLGPRFGHDFSRIWVYSPAPTGIQPKLRVSTPNDRYEQEANRIADQLMPMPEPPLQRQAILPPLLPEQERLEAEEEEETLEAEPLAGRTTQLVQRQAMPEEEKEEEPLQDRFAISRMPIRRPDDSSATANVTGMPGGLKMGLEGLSDFDLSGVRVHKNSSKPARVNALAYTQGREIHMAPGQERHLPHEGWHAVQQLQGRVKPTINTNGVAINADKKLEREADVMGAKALEMKHLPTTGPSTHVERAASPHLLSDAVIQRLETTTSSVLPEHLIDQHTSWGNLDEEALGKDLLSLLPEQSSLVNGVFDELSSSDRDDVAYEMTRAASDLMLEAFAQSASGRQMLDRLFDELTSGMVAEEEQTQADRIMRAKARQISPERFPQDLANVKIFPNRLSGLTVLDSAPIFAERRSGGRIWVKMPPRVLGTHKFRAEIRTLPLEVFTSGLELPEDEIIGVKMYDLGGEVHFRPALYLIQLANETTTNALMKMGEAAAIGLTLGTGALAGLGIRAGMAARVLLWADRVAFVLGTITLVIREHRGWIISTFGETGARFLRYVDLVNSALLIYGGARVAIGMGQLVAGLRSSYRHWREATRQAQQELSASEQTVVNKISRDMDDFLNTSEEIAGARQPSTAPGAETSPTIPPAAGETSSTAPPSGWRPPPEETTAPPPRVGKEGPAEPVPPGAVKTRADVIQKNLEQEGLTPSEILGFSGGEHAQNLSPASAARVERLLDHFTTKDLKVLGKYLFDNEIILDDAGVDALIKGVRPGEMGAAVRKGQIAQVHGEATRLPEGMKETSMLEDPKGRATITDMCSPKSEPSRFLRGNFAHKFAQQIFGNRLPRPNEAEVVVALRDGTNDIIRVDRIIRNAEEGVLIEIKPAGSPWAKKGMAQLPARLKALQKEFPKKNGWRSMQLEYTRADVEAWLRAEGVPEKDIPEIMKEFGF